MKNLLSKIVDWLYSLRCKVSGHVWVTPKSRERVCIRCRKIQTAEQAWKEYEANQPVFPEKEWQTEIEKTGWKRALSVSVGTEQENLRCLPRWKGGNP